MRKNNNQSLKINLGCGSDYRQGWVNIDALEEYKPDIIHDLHSALPLADKSAEYVLAQDILEHFTKEDLSRLLSDLSRVTRNEGLIEIRVPSVAAITDRLRKYPEARNQFLYGTTAHTGIFGAHKVGFSPEYLVYLFLSNGFTLKSWKLEDTNYHAVFKKTNQREILKTLTIVAHTFGLGGAEQFITQLTEDFAKRGIQVEVWTNHKPWITLLQTKKLLAKKVPIAIDIIGDWKGLLKASLLLPLVLITDGWMVWQTRKSNAILLSGFSQKLTVSLWAALWRRPLIWIEFGPLESVLKKFGQLPKLAYYLAKKLPQILIVPSFHTFQHLISGAKIDLAKLRTIPCGVSVPNDRFSRPSTIPNRVVCVSRLEPGKGQDRLIVAFKAVAKAIPTAHLRIIGEGGFDQTLRQLIEKNQLTKHVELVGRVPNSLEEMKQAEICVIPSTWQLEGFGLTVVEAMMLAKPVIIFDIPPLNELVENEVTGLIINDDASQNELQLSKSIIRLLKDAQLREKLGRLARKQVNLKYSFEQIGSSYIEAIEEAMQRMQAREQLKRVGWSAYNE